MFFIIIMRTNMLEQFREEVMQLNETKNTINLVLSDLSKSNPEYDRLSRLIEIIDARFMEIKQQLTTIKV